MSNLIILDLDGTAVLSDGDYSDLTLTDPYLNPKVMEQIKDRDVWIVTGRPDSQYDLIRKLFKCKCELKAISCYKLNDYGTNTFWANYWRYKRSKFAEIAEIYDNGVEVWDDDPRVLEIADSLGLETVYFTEQST